MSIAPFQSAYCCVKPHRDARCSKAVSNELIRPRVQSGLSNSLNASVVALFAAALSEKCDQILAFLGFRDQEVHVIAGDKNIGIRKPFVQRYFVPHDVCLLQGGRIGVVSN